MKRLHEGWRARLVNHSGQVVAQGDFVAMIVALGNLPDDAATVLLPRKPHSSPQDRRTLH